MQSKVVKLIFSVFAITWMVIMFAEYWRYNPNYSKAIEGFQYYDLLVTVLGIAGLLTWYVKKKSKKPINYLNGLTILGGMLVLDIIAVNRFCAKVSGIDFTVQGLFSHVGHIIGVAICIFLVYLVVKVIGELFTSIFPMRISNTDLPLIQTALGIMLFTFLLFFLGLIGVLNGFVIIPICVLLLAFYWKHAFQVVKKTLITPIQIPKEISAVGIFSFVFLALFLILNFVQILRPFPIGSDSLRLYVNLPNMLAEYGSLIDGNQPYNWSLFMSTGRTVFGRIDVVLGLSFLGGLLALFALWRLSRKWLGVNYSALVLVLFYSLPMISFLSYMDMKIDMALMFVSLCILLLLYNWMRPVENDASIQNTKGPGLTKAQSFFKRKIPTILKKQRIPVLIGLLAGFAFGIKLTILFFFLAMMSSIWYFKGGKVGFLTSFFLIFGTVFILQLDAQPGLRQFHDGVGSLQWILLAIGLGFLGYLLVKQKKKLTELLTYSLIIGCFFALPILPWLGKNFSETQQLSVTALLNGKLDSPVFKLNLPKGTQNQEEVIIPGLYQLPEVTQDNPKQKNNKKNQKNKGKKKGNKKKNSKKKKSNDLSEDLHKFMGYEVTPARYLSMPHDVLAKTNIKSFFTDVGFVLLLLFPFLFLFGSKKNGNWKSILASVSFIALSILALIISIPSAFLNYNDFTWARPGKKLLNESEPSGFIESLSHFTNSNLLELYAPINNWFIATTRTGDYITYPILILLFLTILTLVYNRIKEHSKSTQSIIVFLVMYGFLWWILSSGAPWYGLLLFSLPLIFLFKNVAAENVNSDQPEDQPDFFRSFRKYAFLSVGFLWILFAFVHRSSNYEPVDAQRVKNLYYPAIMDYQLGNINEKGVMDYHFPNVRSLTNTINKDKRSKVYMIGSPFNYFIDKNDSRVLSDTYMDFFSLLIKKYKGKTQIIKKLKDEGFGYIIFDLNMMTYDETPDKSLTRKFVQFMNTLYNNPGVELMATDRKVKLYDTGQEAFSAFQDRGDITVSGTFAIFKIK